jgi:hypothetical protein
MVDIPSDYNLCWKPLINFEIVEVTMPPNPFKFLKNIELTPEQRRDLKAKLEKRERDLKAAMAAVQQGIKQLRVALAQDPPKKAKRKPKS